ncbi:MAG TPA: ATP-binding protein [Anaeromyxobacteraceae bacterium]|nr:ATP-binding protein [Anaeromyxobacteraceae bacterium]
MRIRTRILGAALLVVAVVNIAYATYFIRRERAGAMARLQRSIAETETLLQVVIGRPLYDGDVEQLGTDLDSFFTDPSMVRLVLEEYDGDIRLERTRPPAAPLGTEIHSQVVVHRGRDALGEIRGTWSTALLERQLVQSRNGILLFSAALVLGLFAVMYLVVKQFTDPIARLSQAARAMADGHLDREIRVEGAQELASLARSFVRMRDAIREKMTDLADKNQKLREEIAQRHVLEDQLLQSQKMEAVGRLAGGIAHDFNNLLTVINGHCDLLLRALSPESPASADVEVIRQAGESASALTRQLLAFSRKQVLQPKVLGLNEMVGRAESMLRRVIGEDVELVTHLGEGLWPVRADPGQLEQVILNLAVNSRDAMPEGGKLTIETGNVALDESDAQRHLDVRPGPYVMLAVTDTGAGMDAETLARVFEPFFTTKGQGTGLGLSTVYGIVKQSGGTIRAHSEPGRGTTFRIYFPREHAAPVAEKRAPEPAVREHRGQTVLVVEDSDPVRDLVSQVLARGGYSVLKARCGEEALQVAAQHPGTIHLLITDVVMPGMRGREVADRIAAARPETRILYVSGYTEDAIVHHGVLEAGIDFLGKPFTPQALERKVDEILARPPPPPERRP